MLKRSSGYLKICLLGMLFVTLFLTSGCGLPPLNLNVWVLAEDVLDKNEGFESIVFLRVRVKDNSSMWHNSHPYIVIDSYKDNDLLSLQINNVKSVWGSKQNAAYLDSFFVTQVKKADFELKVLRLSFDSHYWLDISLDDCVWTTQPGSLIYLGSLDVEIDGDEQTKMTFDGGYNSNSKFNVKYNLRQDSMDIKDAKRDFQIRYPQLYGQYHKNFSLAHFYHFYEGFNSNNKRGWPVGGGEFTDSEAYFNQSNNEYTVISRTRNGSNNFSIKLPEKLPVNYDIILDSLWEKGDTDYGYGLLIGSEWKTSYRFLIYQNGGTLAALVINGKVVNPTIGYKKVPVVTKALGNGKASNRQTIKVRGDQYSYFLNDTLVGTFRDAENFNNLVIGVSVEGRQHIVLDTLKIIHR